MGPNAELTGGAEPVAVRNNRPSPSLFNDLLGKENMGIEDTIKEICEKLCVNDPRFRIAKNEADATTAHDPAAQEFLKMDQKRIGRDFKLYGFMSRLSGPQLAIADFAETLVVVQSEASKAFEDIKDIVIQLEANLDEHMRAEWRKLWA